MLILCCSDHKPLCRLLKSAVFVDKKASCTFNLPLSIKSPLHFFNSPFVPAQHSAGVNFGRNVRIAAISDFRRVWPSSRLEWMVKQQDGSLTMRVEGISPS